MRAALGSWVLAGVLLVALPEAARAQEGAPDQAQQVEPTKVTLKVHGMVCDGCKARLEKKLEKTEGVESVSVDLDAGRAEVVLEPGTTISDEQFKSIVTDLGFHLISIERRPAKAAEGGQGS